MRFSDFSSSFSQPTNALYVAKAKREAQGEPVIDLVSGNVNHTGIHFPEELLARALVEGQRKSIDYHPHPLGQLEARNTIAAYYKQEGLTFPPEHILLTPGTSMGYAYLFKLLGNPGDAFLCPKPNYPLFDSIAEFCGVKLEHYSLQQIENQWTINFESLKKAITHNTKAIVLVSPHNPTGHVASKDEIDRLTKIANEHQLPIIVDEVFAPFVFPPNTFYRPATSSAPLVFTLNGFSKMFALPGMKVAWIAISGNTEWVQQSMQSLELMADSFLPINEIAQFAAPLIFKEGYTFLKNYQMTISKRRDECIELLRKSPFISLSIPQGGFYISLKLKKGDEDEIAVRLLEQHGILTHPGYFYDFEENGMLVISFVSETKNIQTLLNALQ